MGAGRYAAGVALSLVCLVPIGWAALALRRRLLPRATGPGARVAEVTVALGLLTVALQAAGAVGALDRLGVIFGCLLLAGVAGGLAQRGPRARPRARPVLSEEPLVPAGSAMSGAERPAGSVERLVAAAAVAVVGSVWIGWTVYAYRHGPQRVDTLWYHLPAAARFVQQGTIAHLHYFDSQPITVFYPFDSELLHAFGLVMFGTDLLSPLINLGWAALALAAAWSLGRSRRRAPLCLLAAAIVLGTPGLVDTQPGGAYNDVACIALLLVAAAVLAVHRPGPRAGAVAAIAAGLAFGTKFTMIVPVGALAVGAVVAWDRDARLRQAAVWVLGLLVCGGYWYLRNLVLVGNPLPSLALHLGPLSLPAPRSGTPSFTVAQYLTDSSVWQGYFLPGLRRSLGLAWPAMLVLYAAGALGALLRGPERGLRLLGAVAIIAGIAFVVSPQALGVPGAPLFFVFNVRYATPALALGLVLGAALAPPLRGEIRGRAWYGLGALVLALTELDPGVWPTGLGLRPFDAALHGTASLAGAAAGLAMFGLAALAFRRPWVAGRALAVRRPLTAAALTGGLLVLGAAGFAVARGYPSRRYASTAPLPEIYRWAQGLHHARIGIVGFTEQYPLYGSDDSNHVQYIGAAAPHRGYAPVTGCAAWQRAVARGRYGWLVVAPAGFPLGHGEGPEVGWSRADGARPVLAERPAGPFAPQTVVVLRVSRTLRPAGCASAR